MTTPPATSSPASLPIASPLSTAASGAAVRIERAALAIESLRAAIDAIDRIAETIAARLAAGGTVYTAGNGGSAAEALHLAEELIGRYRSNRPPLRAVALTADPTALTCIANDFGFDEVFARPCEALLTPADILVLFTTSGRSPNLLRAASVGRRKRALVIGLLGGDGGPLREQCDEAILVGGGLPADQRARLDSAAIQEAHQVILHAICERLESPLPAPLSPSVSHHGYT
jgi:D-sedoheptulose 7-phosphate isomerase